MMTDRDEKFMRAALVEAKKALGRTSPNPAVGAVLVIDNRIVVQQMDRHRAAICNRKMRHVSRRTADAPAC